MYTAKCIVRELKKLSHKENFVRPLGIELECWVYENDEPVDLTEHIEFLEEIPGVWACGTELGKNMLEVAFNPESDIQGYQHSMIDFFEHLSEGTHSRHWVFLFAGETSKRTIGWVQKPRYITLIQALSGESDLRHKVIRNMTSNAALQINVGVGTFRDGVYSHKAKKLLFAFNNWGPALCLYFEQMCDDLAAMRLAHCYDFADVERGMRYITWEDCERLNEVLYEIPQLIREEPTGSGNWVVHDEHPQDLIPAHTGTIWWLARAQGIGDKKAERIEIRSINSMSPMQSVTATIMINRLVQFILDTEVSDLPIVDYETWEFIRLKKKPEASLAIALNFLKSLPLK